MSGTGSDPPAVVFDLDGTLVDSRPGIERALTAAIAQVIPELGPLDLARQIGPPLPVMLERLLPGIEERRREEVAWCFRRAYDAEAWSRTVLQPGVADGLQELSRYEARLYVVTNKPQHPTRRILGLPGLAGVFARAVSVDSSTASRCDKTAALRWLVDHEELAPWETTYVGDTDEDARAAAAAGVRFIGVTWGYGFDVAAIQASPFVIAQTVHDLLHLIVSR